MRKDKHDMAFAVDVDQLSLQMEALNQNKSTHLRLKLSYRESMLWLYWLRNTIIYESFVLSRILVIEIKCHCSWRTKKKGHLLKEMASNKY